MPICVAGMHRSGTSLIAQILHAGGLFLGPESDLMPAGRGNADGHWENVNFVAINEAILEIAGGTWKDVPSFPPGWHRDSKFDRVQDQAAALVAKFAGREPWGWKDPRNSITLPFWRLLVPDLKIVIVIRNPLDIAQSLALRDGIEMPDGVHLWAAYMSRLVAEAPRDRRLVSHYESYFANFHAEAERLFAFAGLPFAHDAIKPLAKDELRHNRRPLAELIDGHIQFDFVRMYFDHCAEAGPVFLRKFPVSVVEAVAPAALEGGVLGDAAAWGLGRLAEQMIGRDLTIADLKRQIAALDDAHANACVQRDTLRRENEQLVDRLSAKRHQWADRIAGWLNKLRGR